MATTGIMGQLTGPFSSNDNIITLIGRKEGLSTPIFFKLGISLGEKDYMVYTRESVVNDCINVIKRFTFTVDLGDGDEEFWLGKTYIYESDEGLYIASLKFPEGAPASTLIEYTILPRD